MVYNSSFIVMALANMCTAASFGTFYLFPLFIADLGGSKADIGILMGVFTLSSVICRPWISEMIDRIGRKKSYMIGCIVMSLLPLSYLHFQKNLAEAYPMLIIIRFVHGAGLAMCFTAAFTYVSDIVSRDRLNEGIGMFGVTGLTGMALGPVIAEMAIQRFGFASLFFAGSGLALAGLIAHLPLHESYVRLPMTEAPSFFSVLTRKNAMFVAFLSFLFGLGLAASGGFVSPFAAEKGVTFVSAYYLSYSASAVTIRFFGGRFADRVGEKRIIPYAMLLNSAGLVTLAFLGDTEVLIIAGILSGFGHGFLFPCLNSLMVRDEPAYIRGKLTGIFTGGIDTGILIGSFALGHIGKYEGYRFLFFAASICLLAGFVVSKTSAARTR
jgi:MFS family permease